MGLTMMVLAQTPRDHDGEDEPGGFYSPIGRPDGWGDMAGSDRRSAPLYFADRIQGAPIARPVRGIAANHLQAPDGYEGMWGNPTFFWPMNQGLEHPYGRQGEDAGIGIGASGQLLVPLTTYRRGPVVNARGIPASYARIPFGPWSDRRLAAPAPSQAGR